MKAKELKLAIENLAIAREKALEEVEILIHRNCSRFHYLHFNNPMVVGRNPDEHRIEVIGVKLGGNSKALVLVTRYIGQMLCLPKWEPLSCAGCEDILWVLKRLEQGRYTLARTGKPKEIDLQAERYHFQINHHNDLWSTVPAITRWMRWKDADQLAQRLARFYKCQVRRTRGAGKIETLNGRYFNPTVTV